MRSLILFFLLWSTIVHSQLPSRYTAVYTKTVETNLALTPDKLRINTGDNPIARERAEQALKDLTGTPVQLRFQDSLVIIPDSVTVYQVPCAAPGMGAAVRLNIKETKTVIKPDSYYYVREGGAAEVKERAAPMLTYTDTTERILNYTCEVYKSSDGKLKIWISRDLPSSINGGLPLRISLGAVIKYELNNGDQKAVATLIKLQAH